MGQVRRGTAKKKFNFFPVFSFILLFPPLLKDVTVARPLLTAMLRFEFVFGVKFIVVRRLAQIVASGRNSLAR